MSEEKDKYLNFPIHFVQGFMDDHVTTLIHIMNYCCYKKVMEVLEWGDDIEAFKSALKYYELYDILDDDEIVERCFLDGEKIYNSTFSKSPITGLKVDVFFDYFHNDKTEFQLVVLLGFLAMKSIIGNKTYFKGTDMFWLSRMDGQLKSYKEVYELSDKLKKFSNRYQKDKIKEALTESWGLIYYSYRMRGWYASFRMTTESLIEVAERRKPKVLKELKKNKILLIREEILKKIEGEYKKN